ncbi:hypothetical protein TTHERM_01006530 (macronuclear) [Tetrahymena thermophila SB210]|uniref:EGF-like domain-containing protein n=1 Tax=Tetrahymena thermophila (strain SB210) TaxID=312017 RepID=Q22D07_TETTS|nr:hypothetical protein TTHERM_01006530 [Tetrahymena thermophila SB210]EAR83182.2 hypothetical protein TTHERM_01006530 [Tetrahymena thermophila SB210]|eukprot:XP_001030845.2 hypothetical protein TTHERM_01006530 [Tetrahymena thermophila SB210]
MNLNYIIHQSLLSLLQQLENLLIAREWLNPPFTGWGSGKSIICAGQLIEANKEVLYIGDGQKSVQKQFQNLPEHFRVLVRIDFVAIDEWDGSQKIIFSADSQTLGSYSSYSQGPGDRLHLKICGKQGIQDRFERVQYVISHTSNTVTIKAETNSKGYAGLLDLQIYVDTCHADCKGCSGASENQCSSCKTGATLSSGKCVCPTNQYMYQGSCLPDCTGNLRKSSNGLFCEEIPCKLSTCRQCDSDNFTCAACVGSYRRFNKSCVKSCPSYTENVNGECIELTKKYWNGMFLFKGFFEDDFSNLSFEEYGFNFNPILPEESNVNLKDWAQFSDCNDNSVLKRFYGGFGIIGKDVSIKKTWDIVDQNKKPIKHSSVLVKFYYAQVENYEELKDGVTPEEEFVKINDQKIFSLYGGGTQMGCGRLDQGENFGWIEANSTQTNKTNQIKLEIGNNFIDPAWYEGFGIREMMIIVSRCIDNCEECGDYDGCVRCSTGYYLWRAQCYKDKCPDGSFLNQDIKTSNVCKDCHPTCLTCNGPKSDQCLTCLDPLLFKKGSCNLDCGLGFYPNKPICSPCHTECYSCFGPNNNQCLKCTGNRYYFKQTNSCLLECPETYFPNTHSNYCDPCNSKCLTCDGPSENQCLTCTSVAPSRFLMDHKCEAQCPPGYYGETADQTCQPCKSPCVTCKNTANKCTSCIDKRFLYGEECLENCPDRTYSNTFTQMCEACHGLCGNCNGANFNNCLTCDDEDGYYDSTTNQCVSQCPSKYFATKENKLQICKLCDITCGECKSPGDKFSCTICTGGRYLNYNNSCDKDCPDYYYKDRSNYVCKNCHPSCLTCHDSSSTSCITCPKGRYFSQNTCLSRCPEGTYPDDVNSQCILCHPSCASCDGDLYNQCTRCKLGKYLQDKKCSEKCKDGYFPNKLTGMCQICHQTCATCADEKDSSCLSCKSPLYLSNNKCFSLCPDGQYHNNNTNQCESCPFTCKTCLGVNKDECLSCSGNRYLVRPGLKCETVCPTGFLPNQLTNECDQCHSSCKNCFGLSENECKECPSGTYLYQNKCLLVCPMGFFPTEFPNICTPCHSTCQTCTGSLESQCTSCKGKRYYLPYKCLEECPDSYFGDNANNSCQKCDKSCKTCIGVNNNQCTKCKEGTYLLNNSCVFQCPDGYVVSLDKAQCLICHSTCSTCHPGNLDYCLTCLEGWYKHANRCLKECPDGTYPSSKSEEKINGLIHEILICKNCIKNCKTCTGPSDVQCLEYYPVSEQDLLGMLIFYIFIGKSVYCFLTFAVGIYLDYNEYKRKREIELFEAQKTEIEDQRNKDIPKITVNDVELNKTAKTDQKLLFNFDNTNKDYSPTGSHNITRQNLNTDNQSPTSKIFKNSPVRKQRKFQTAINPSEQHESMENEKLRYTKFRKGTYGQNQSIVNVSTQKLVDEELKSQIAKKHGKIVGCYDPVSKSFVQIPDYLVKKNPELPQKSFISFFFTFFEITSLFLYRDSNLLHILRVLTYYCKLLFMFYLSSRLLYISPLSIIGFVVAIQIIMVSIEKIIYNLSLNIEKLLSVIFTSFILLIVYHINWFFSPQLAKISYQQDFDWSIYYLTIFGTDMVGIQIVFMSIQYWFTKKHVFTDQLKLRKSQRILCFFLFKDKFARWLKEQINFLLKIRTFQLQELIQFILQYFFNIFRSKADVISSQKENQNESFQKVK